MRIIDLLAIFITASMTGAEFAIAALIHPALRRIEPASRAASLSSLATTMGRFMPFWYALGLILIAVEAYLRRDPLIEIASGLWFLGILLTVIFLVPINNRIAKSVPGPASFDREHALWDTRHRWRVVLLVVATGLLMEGILKG